MPSAVIGALRVNLSANTADFRRQMTDAEKIAFRVGQSIGSTLRKQMLAFGAAVAAVAGPAALGLLVKSSFETISAQVDLARRVGASVAAIQTLQYATQLAGGSAESLNKALGIVNARLGEAAREGAGPAYDAIQRLGLSIKDLSNMDADERIIALSDRMKELGYSTQQQADLLRSFGIRQLELINLFQEGSQAITEARAELEAWGVILSDVDAAKVEQAGDAWEKIWTVLRGVGNQIAVRVAPLLESLAEYIGEAAKGQKGFGDIIDQTLMLGIRLWAGVNREIYDFRVFVDEAGAAILNLWDALAGAPANVLAKIFGGEAEDYGFKPINESWGNLRKNLELPPSDAQLIEWFNNIKKRSDEAAEVAVKNNKKIFGEDDDQLTERQQKEADRFREQSERKLAALREALMTESEAEKANYDERMALIEDFHNRKMISDEEYNKFRLAATQGYAKRLMEIDDEIRENNERNAERQRDGWFDVANTIGGALESIFGESKAVAIAQAIINTAQAVTRSLAEYGATPLGLAAAAAAAVAGAAQIATIMRTNKSSKGGGANKSAVTAPVASGGSSSSSSSNNGGASQTLHITGINPSSLYSGEAVRRLAEALVEYQRDGGQVVLGNT